MRNRSLLLSFGIFIILFSLNTRAQDVPAEYIKLKTLSDDKHIGKILEKDDQKIVLQTLEGSKIEFPTNIILETIPIDSNKIRKGKYWFENLHDYKYLISSSAVPLKKKSGYVQLLELGLFYTQVGLTDHLSIGGGGLLWGAIKNRGPLLVYANVKYSSILNQKWYAGVELQSIGSNTQFYALSTTTNKLTLMGRGLVTYLGFRLHVTASAGYGVVRNQTRLFSTGDPILAVSYHKMANVIYGLNMGLRISPRFSFVLENTFYPRHIYYSNRQTIFNNNLSYMLFQSIGFAINGERMLFGIGAAHESRRHSLFDDVIPYIDLAYKFGGNK